MSRAGELDMKIALTSIEYLANETSYAPWHAAMDQLYYVDNMLKRTEIYGMFKQVMAALLEPSFTRISLTSSLNDTQDER